MNSNSKNEMNIRISLCNVRRVNEMLDISLEVVPNYRSRVTWVDCKTLKVILVCIES